MIMTSDRKKKPDIAILWILLLTSVLLVGCTNKLSPILSENASSNIFGQDVSVFLEEPQLSYFTNILFPEYMEPAVTTTDNPNAYYADFLTLEELEIVKGVVTGYELEKVVGKIILTQVGDTGHLTLFVVSERYGELLLTIHQTNVNERPHPQIIRCLVLVNENNEKPYLIFSKYPTPELNDSPW